MSYLFCASCGLDVAYAQTRVIELNSIIVIIVTRVIELNSFIVISNCDYFFPDFCLICFRVLFISQPSLLRLPATANLANSLTQ